MFAMQVADAGQPRTVSFKFGTPLMPNDRTANELKGLFVAQVMDSSSVLYQGVVTRNADRACTLRELGESFLAASVEAVRGPLVSDASASNPQAAIEQARARRRAQNMLNTPHPQDSGSTNSSAGNTATQGSTRNALNAAADIAAKEHARLTP